MAIAIQRAALCLGLALATLTAVMPGPASAQRPDYHRQRQDERWREQHRYDGYERRPDIYYTAPPVVPYPYGYESRPGAALILNFPFYR